MRLSSGMQIRWREMLNMVGTSGAFSATNASEGSRSGVPDDAMDSAATNDSEGTRSGNPDNAVDTAATDPSEVAGSVIPEGAMDMGTGEMGHDVLWNVLPTSRTFHMKGTLSQNTFEVAHCSTLGDKRISGNLKQMFTSTCDLLTPSLPFPDVI